MCEYFCIASRITAGRPDCGIIPIMATKNINYRALSAELDEVLGKLQAGEVDVDEAVKLYERGITITGQLEAYLKTAENKVRKVQTEWEKGA